MLRDEIMDIVRDKCAAKGYYFGSKLRGEIADAILDLKIECFDNSIATGPRYWTKTLRELEGE